MKRLFGDIQHALNWSVHGKIAREEPNLFRCAMFEYFVLAGFMRIWSQITIAETRHDEGVVYEDARESKLLDKTTLEHPEIYSKEVNECPQRTSAKEKRKNDEERQGQRTCQLEHKTGRQALCPRNRIARLTSSVERGDRLWDVCIAQFGV